MTRPIPDPLPDPSLLANPVWVAMASPEEVDAAWALLDVESICLDFMGKRLLELFKPTGDTLLSRLVPGEGLADVASWIRRVLHNGPDA